MVVSAKGLARNAFFSKERFSCAARLSARNTSRNTCVLKFCLGFRRVVWVLYIICTRIYDQYSRSGYNVYLTCYQGLTSWFFRLMSQITIFSYQSQSPIPTSGPSHKLSRVSSAVVPHPEMSPWYISCIPVIKRGTVIVLYKLLKPAKGQAKRLFKQNSTVFWNIYCF